MEERGYGVGGWSTAKQHAAVVGKILTTKEASPTLPGLAASVACIVACLLWIIGLALPWWDGADSKTVVYLDQYSQASATWTISLWLHEWQLAVGDTTLAAGDPKSFDDWQLEVEAYCETCQDAGDKVLQGRGVAVLAGILAIVPAVLFTVGCCSACHGNSPCTCCPARGTMEAILHLLGLIFAAVVLILMISACSIIGGAAWDVAMSELFQSAITYTPAVSANGGGFVCAVLALLMLLVSLGLSCVAVAILKPCIKATPKDSGEGFVDQTVVGSPVYEDSHQHHLSEEGKRFASASTSGDAGSPPISPSQGGADFPPAPPCKICGAPRITSLKGKVVCKTCRKAARRQEAQS